MRHRLTRTRTPAPENGGQQQSGTPPAGATPTRQRSAINALPSGLELHHKQTIKELKPQEIASLALALGYVPQGEVSCK
ncbi:MAG: hypothetical protein RIR70_308 [Pseudomonadota bacterium]